MVIIIDCGQVKNIHDLMASRIIKPFPLYTCNWLYNLCMHKNAFQGTWTNCGGISRFMSQFMYRDEFTYLMHTHTNAHNVNILSLSLSISLSYSLSLSPSPSPSLPPTHRLRPSTVFLRHMGAKPQH